MARARARSRLYYNYIHNYIAIGPADGRNCWTASIHSAQTIDIPAAGNASPPTALRVKAQCLLLPGVPPGRTPSRGGASTEREATGSDGTTSGGSINALGWKRAGGPARRAYQEGRSPPLPHFPPMETTTGVVSRAQDGSRRVAFCPRHLHPSHRAGSSLPIRR